MESTDYYGVTHPVTLSANRKLSRMLVDTGQYEKALPLLVELAEKHVLEFGADAGLTFGVRQYLAQALAGLRRYDEARAVLEETLEILTSLRGKDHEYTMQARAQLEEFLTERKEAAE